MSAHHFEPGRPSNVLPPSKSKQKLPAVGVGIAAGAEDAKYQAKYRDLKRKVKQIEAENDKLQYSVLEAKRNIQRMRVERAVLYDRLSTPQDPCPVPRQLDLPVPDPPREQPVSEYSIPHPRLPPPSAHPSYSSALPRSPPPRSIPYDPPNHLQYLPPPPPPSLGPSRHVTPSVSRTHSSSRPRSRSPPLQPHPHSRASYLSGPPQYHSEPIPPRHHIVHHPPSVEWESSARQDFHEYPTPHSDPRSASRHSAYSAHHSPPTDSRQAARVHNHQRLGPGTYINREEHYQSYRDADWDHHHRLRERERVQDMDYPRENRPSHSLSSSQMRDRYLLPPDRGEYSEHYLPPRAARDDHKYYRDLSNSVQHSRSGSPGSGSGSGFGGREGTPDARTHYYDPDRGNTARSFKLRPVHPTKEELDYVHEDSRSHRTGAGDRGASNYPPLLPPPLRHEHSRSSLDLRKRSHSEMDVDDDDLDQPSPARRPSAGRLTEDRNRR